MAGEPIRAVLLDAFGTLVEFEPPAPHLRAELRTRLGVEVGLAQAEAAIGAEIAYYRAGHDRGRDAESLRTLRLECGDVVRRALGLAAPVEEVTAALLAAIRFRAYPEAAAVLAGLRARGARLAVVSNWDASLPEVLDRVGLGGAVDAVLASAREGIAKPDARIFSRALARVGARARETVHVGDSVEYDVRGAEAAGVAPLLLLRDGATAPPGVPVIRALDELLSLPF
jgi:putative hydrolase of the HAD superfamily